MAKSASERNLWLRRAGWIGLGAAGSMVALVGVASFPLSSLLVRPRLKRLSHLKRPHIRNMLGRLGIEVQDVSITSFDSTRLNGWWIEASKDAPTIVILHGVKNNRTDVLRAALVLRREGFNILMFDGRGHGDSGGRYVTYGFFERRDVESVLQWLVEEKGVRKDAIGLAGESMGAAIALQVAAANPWISAVWVDSPFASLKRIAAEFASRATHLPTSVLSPLLWTTIRVANYRGKFDVEMVDPLALAAQINSPVFIVHGTADKLIEPSHSISIYEALSGRKELWLVEGARHARAVRHVRREYSERIRRFFRENLTDKSVPAASDPAA
jgi:fermentation-respiration switch protein FrsA (DUF1100 family)